MRINRVIKHKGTHVATIEPDTTVAAACHELRSQGVGALIVSSGPDDLAGIISERDITRSLADRGAATLELRVSDLMTREVITCCLEDTVHEIMRVMTEGRVRHVPVVEDRMLVGVVSIGDMVKHRLGELEEENHTLHDYIETGR